MSLEFICNVHRSGTIAVIWGSGMLAESTVEDLKEQILSYLDDEDIPIGPVQFDFSEAVIVINTAFDQLKDLCRRCVEKGREVIFVNPSHAMSDFLSIAENFQFTVQTT